MRRPRGDRGRTGAPRRLWFRARAACGIAGPVVFTGAWLLCTARQEGTAGYTARAQHVSGLAASDALTPAVMSTGFGILGVCTLGFASAVAETLGRAGARHPKAAPALIRVGGGAALVATVARRDRMLLGPPPDDPGWRQSWRNDLHDAASALGYASMIAAPPALVIRSGDVPWRPLGGALVAGSLAAAALIALFASNVAVSHNGLVQRAALSVPLSQMAAVALALLKAS